MIAEAATGPGTAGAQGWGRLGSGVVEPWADLVNTLAVADDTGEALGPADLAEQLTAHDFSPQQDSWAVWDRGRMVGDDTVHVSAGLDADGRARVQLGGGVRPSHRGRGTGRDEVELDVDSGSPTGAGRVYERLGFTRPHLSAVCVRDLV